MKKIFFLLITAAFLGSCQDEDMSLKEPPFITNAGSDLMNIEEFKVRLDADDLNPNESGTWTLFSGLVDSKVFFNDKYDPKTFFNGLPGEEYKLIWELTSGKRTTTDTVTVSFSPLKTEITDWSSDLYKTRLQLEAKLYEKGEWTVEGDYHHIRSLQGGGVKIPDQEFPGIMFYGLANTKSKITWTTWYGSKSASATIDFNGGDYQQYEALEDLSLLNDPTLVKKNENGDVIEIIMNGDRRAWRFSYLDLFPALQSLVHLERLELAGNGLQIFPEVIPLNYHKLKELTLSSNFLDSIPESFGNLTELETFRMHGSKLEYLPESFGNLTNLKHLELNGNYLTDLPESFGDLSNLIHLNIELNTLNKLPESFGNLRNLETFRGPTILQSIPQSFSNLEKLKFCFFFIESNTAILPDDFGRLTALETLWLHGNYQYLPENFVNLVNLESLRIIRGSGIRKLPEDFGNLVNLRELHMTIRLEHLPPSFTKLINLRALNFHGELKHLPYEIGKLHNLEAIGVSHLKLEELPESMGNLRNLKELSASTNNIPDIPSTIGNLTKLARMDIGRNRIKHFPPGMANLSNNLRELIIVENEFSDEELNSIRQMLPYTDITFSYNK
jgi:Leucine-rich repeat (LRR) protein